ncbi:hypothetical protein P261_02260 [Lachnospiraceae bacterium TWA4]|nr:hypothetical protein P261_02260 [Lachnospiraceae bacterium TWA4]
MSIFDEWNKNIDTEGLAKDTKEAEANGGSGDYPEVPVGTYEVGIEKLELRESSNHKPMVTAWFKILQGEYANSLLFMNQIVLEGWQIGSVNRFLRSLESGVNVEFKDYVQYNNLIMDIQEAIDGKLEFLLEYKKSKKDFPIYTIKEVYEV